MSRNFETPTDKERELWLDNDEGLYCLWKSSKLNKKTFISQNRKLIDEVRANVLSGKKPAHYLRYG